MSLLSSAMTKCVRLIKTSSSDGEAGQSSSFAAGAEFDAAIVFDTSAEGRVAEQQVSTNQYVIITERETVLEFHDVFKRLSDGMIFRVISAAEVNKTPASASLNMRKVIAEEWKLTGVVA